MSQRWTVGRAALAVALGCCGWIAVPVSASWTGWTQEHGAAGAEEAGHRESAPGGSAAQGGAHGLAAGDHEPHYELVHNDTGTAIWSILVFLALLALLSKYAWGPIQELVIKREKFITDSLEEARREREEATRLVRDLEVRRADADKERQAIMAEARRDAQTLAAESRHKSEAEAQALLDRAKREIRVAQETALKELYDRSAALATDIAGRILGRELSAAGHEDLVRQSIKELDKVTLN